MISIIICTYNRQDCILRPLEALKEESFKDFEVILVDNNSSDRSPELIKDFCQKYPDFPLHYFLETRQGRSYARNRGLNEARGEILVFLDDDALPHKDYLENLSRHLMELPEVSAFGGKIEPLFEKVVSLNSRIAEEGLRGDYGICIGKTIREGIDEGIFGCDLKNMLSSYAAAGSDARMNGCPLPVMTTSGSGNQGMTCSLPIIEFCRMRGIPHDRLIRGLFVSHLITIHIKEVIGRLSAYCGAMAASAGVSGALTYLDGGNSRQIKMAVETTLATVSGVICDGAKSSCATKIATGVSAAVDAFVAARKGRGLSYGEGIVGSDIENTISHIGTLGSDGMKVTDDVILDIMMSE